MQDIIRQTNYNDYRNARSGLMDIENILKKLTAEEKASLVAGTNFMDTCAIERAGIASLRMSDGPHGLRVQAEGGDNGVTGSAPATAFPTAACTACGWDAENLRRIGRAIAEEARYYGVSVVLGPGANIKRNPLAGRNFEYFSEDPLLAGTLAAAEVEGIQENGVAATVKHFALNNAETYRFMGDSVADLRAIREIYLKVFEIIVKQAKPAAMMCAYNKINGEYCSQNKWLLTDVLRTEWGFDGFVMTDWGAMHDRIASLKAGLDLEMPGDTAICRKWILEGLQDGTLSEETLDRACENILRAVEQFAAAKKDDNLQATQKGGYAQTAQKESKIQAMKKGSCAQTVQKESNAQATCKGEDVEAEHNDGVAERAREKCDPKFEAHNALACEIAEDCAVLMKNDGVLPLDERESFCVVGDLFAKMRYQGAGSSMINPTKLTSPKTAFDEMGISYVFARGYAENEISPRQDLIAQAVEMSQNHETVLAFLGLTDYVESEGADREHMRLPENQLALVDALLAAGKKIIVVLFGGSPVELPFADKVSAILNLYLPGQSGGKACANLLFGHADPGGRLAETWPMSYADVPFGEDFAKSPVEVYKESIYVGYRYYLSAEKAVRFPFGFGLSYTSFEIADAHVKQENKEIAVSCTVRNTGRRRGAEVVQVYVSVPQSGVNRPLRELRAFCKVRLDAGESRRAELKIPLSELRYFDIGKNEWVMESGEYEVQICSDCEHILYSKTLTIAGEQVSGCGYGAKELGLITDEVYETMYGCRIPVQPPAKPIRLESRFSDLKATFFGRILYGAVLGVAKKQMQAAKRLPEGAERENRIKGALFLERVLDSNSLVSMSMSAGKSFPYNYAQGFMYLANGHIFKGIGCFCKAIKIKKK